MESFRSSSRPPKCTSQLGIGLVGPGQRMDPATADTAPPVARQITCAGSVLVNTCCGPVAGASRTTRFWSQDVPDSSVDAVLTDVEPLHALPGPRRQAAYPSVFLLGDALPPAGALLHVALRSWPVFLGRFHSSSQAWQNFSLEPGHGSSCWYIMLTRRPAAMAW